MHLQDLSLLSFPRTKIALKMVGFRNKVIFATVSRMIFAATMQ